MLPVCCRTILLAAVVSASAETNSPSSNPEKISYSVNVSYTFDSELERHNIDYGDFSATLLRAGATKTWVLNERSTWNAGPYFTYSHFDTDRRGVLPENGYVTAVQLGIDWQLNEKWGLHGDIRPGLYSDFEDISFGDFNAPFIGAVTYQVNPRTLAVLALGVNLRSDLGTIGGPGVRWQVNDRWVLNLILPKPVIEFALAPAVTLYGGGEWRATSFRVAEDFGRRRGARRLSDDDFSYRELRALGGVRWRLNRALAIDFEGGYAMDRRAEFRDADYTLDGGSAPYLQVGFGGAF